MRMSLCVSYLGVAQDTYKTVFVSESFFLIQASENEQNRFGNFLTHIELEPEFPAYLWFNIWYKVAIVNDLSELIAC